MQDSNELQDSREKLIKSIGETLGLTDFSKESFEAERIKIQNKLEELDPTIKEEREEFERLHGHKTDEQQSKILVYDSFEVTYRMFKDMYFERGVVITIGNLNTFYTAVKAVLKLASCVSVKVKLETIREVKTKVVMSLSTAKKIIEGEKTGLYKQDEYNPPKRQDSLENIENMSNYWAYRFEFSNSPLLVAKANIDIYNDIIRTLDREEEMILIELKNGKGLDDSPLNDKKDNSNPTTSAPVEESEPKGNLVLSQREIALIYHYEDWLLIDGNCNEEVSRYFKKDGTRHRSGKALMDDYRIVNGRIKDWLNQKNTIQNLEKIIPLLQNASGIDNAKKDLAQAIRNRESLF
jgi:hypothetical protein